MADFLLADLYAAEDLRKGEEHKANLGRLAPGDIIFHAGALDHAYMYMGTVHGKPHCRVHARSGVEPYGVYIDLMPTKTSIWFASTIFTCKNRRLATEACNFARAWACNDPGIFKPEAKPEAEKKQDMEGMLAAKAPTGFSDTRFRNLVDSAGPADPFTAASLKRAFKYASRRGQVLSREEGTTCTAFLIACYQAALLWMCTNGNTEGLANAYEELGEILAGEPAIDVEDAWYAVAHHIGFKRMGAEEFFCPSLWLESKTANAGRPWKERIEADGALWTRVAVKEVY